MKWESSFGHILTVLCALKTFLQGVEASGAGPNVPEFNALCHIYQLASYGKTKEPTTLLLSRIDDNKIEGVMREVEDYLIRTNPNDTAYEMKDPTWKRQNPRLLKSGRVHLGYVKLSHIKSELGALKQKIESSRSQAEHEMQLANGLFQAALGGPDTLQEDGTFEVKAAGGNNRGTRCKGDSGEAGESVMKDLLCLCGHKNSYTESCGFDMGGNAWTPANAGRGDIGSHTDKSWQLIKTECDKRKGTPSISPQNISIAVRDFENLIGRHAGSHSAGTAGLRVLGGGFTDATCDGAAANKMCVDYKGTGADRISIQWLTNLLNARSHVQKAMEFVETAQLDLRKVWQLGLAAQIAFVEANATIEIVEPNSHTATQNPTQRPDSSVHIDKKTAQDPNAVSIAAKSRSILPWTLLI